MALGISTTVCLIAATIVTGIQKRCVVLGLVLSPLSIAFGSACSFCYLRRRTMNRIAHNNPTAINLAMASF